MVFRKLIALIFLFCISTTCHADWRSGTRWFTPPATSGFVGNNSAPAEYTGQSPENPDLAIKEVFTASASGQVSYIHVYLGSATSDFNVALYTADGSTKLAEGNLTTVDGAQGQKNFALDTPYTISSGTQYLLVCGSKTDTYWTRGETNDVSYSYYNNVTCDVENTMPSSVSGGTEIQYYKLSIWADNSAT